MSRESVIATALYVIGGVRGRAYQGSAIDNALHYLNLLRNTLTSAGIDVAKVEQLIKSGAVTKYVRYAAGKDLGSPDQRCGGSKLVLDFTDREISVGPATMLDVVVNGVSAVRNYIDIVNELDNHLSRLARLGMDYQQFIETMLNIMRLTLLYVPYTDCGDGTRYSAYAIAHAAMAYASTEDTGGRFRLLGIDIVGIQDIISRIQRTGQAMRQLRGRSILINLIQHAAAVRVINDMNRMWRGDALSTANVLVNTGGEVIMLIPNVPTKVLDSVIDRVGNDALREFEGRIGISIAYTGSYDVATANFRNAMNELKREMLRVRYGRYRKLSVNGNDLCEVCGMASGRLVSVPTPDGSIRMCPFCVMAHNLGTVSRRMGFIARLKRDYWSYYCSNLDLLGIKYVVCDDRAKPIFSNEYVHYELNNLKIGNVPNVAYSTMFANTWMPTEDHERILDLESIRMGGTAFTVRADANLMGKLKGEASRDAATYILFSGVLMTIFDAYGAYLWNTKYRSKSWDRPLFLVYSGGDDIVIIGDYNALDYIANIIRRANEFSINVAVGALLHDIYYPIYLAWAESEERLEEAKRDRNSSLIYVMNVGNAPIILEPSDIWSIVNYVSSAPSMWLFEEAEERASILYRLHKHLVEIYRAFYSVATVSNNESDCLAAKRELVRALIEYTYYFNRNADKLGDVVTRLDRGLLPQNLAKPLLTVKCGDEGNVRQYLRQLGRAIVSINIYVLINKPTQ